MYSIIVLLCCLQIASTDKTTPPSVNISHGEIKGQIKYSRNGRPFHSYTGIPYAQPPVGSLRFSEPKELEPWMHTWDATRDPPTCIQRNYLFSHHPAIVGKEDCLYLNVYVPEIQHSHENVIRPALLPVMVFIHWGAFIAGKSSPGYLGPSYFMDKDVILVTFNYRLGPFGFLSTLDDEAPGNYGFKDQIAALKWVQRNIEHFGGNRDKVTIFGQSAGAGSVHLQMLSSASKGLFHQAITQSGNALAPWASPLNLIQKQLTNMQADFVGCENFTENSAQLIQCLRNVPADEILRTQDNFKSFYGHPLVLFGSVIETKTERNQNPFLIKTPLQYILDGEFRNIPWMTGIVKNEGIVTAASLVRTSEIRRKLNQNFEKIMSDALLLFSISSMSPKSLYKNVTNFYLGGKEFIDIKDHNSIQGFVDLYGDRAFFYPLFQSLLLQSTNGHKPIYLYNFEYEGLYTYGDLFAITKENIPHHWGPSHCDELLYLFESKELFPKLSFHKRSADTNLSRKLTTLWTTFATYGDPNPKENAIHPNFTWKPLNLTNITDVENDDFHLLNITGNLFTGPAFTMENGFYRDRMEFWQDSYIFENMNTVT